MTRSPSARGRTHHRTRDRMRDRAAPAARSAAAGLVLVAAAACADTSIAVQEGTTFRAGGHEYRVEIVADGLAHPWGIAFLPGGDMLVTERPGRLRLIRDGALVAQPLQGVPQVHARGQGGLLDVALHPDFGTNRLVYLSYAKPGPRGATTAVARGRLEEGGLESVEEIFEASAWASAGQHFGSRLVFDRDGHLYVSVGDRGTMANAQDLSTHAGKIVRLHDDGRVPPDNPFAEDADALPEIFAWGVRNPQGMTLHPETGELWETEHGPRGGDEINVIRAGANYGWPVITHGVHYSGQTIGDGITEKEGMEPPLLHWTPSIAVAGMTFYTGDAFPGWRGSVFAAALAERHVARVAFEGTTAVGEERILEDVGRVRSISQGPDGYLYALLDAAAAPLLRIVPAP